MPPVKKVKRRKKKAKSKKTITNSLQSMGIPDLSKLRDRIQGETTRILELIKKDYSLLKRSKTEYFTAKADLVKEKIETVVSANIKKRSSSTQSDETNQ